jgi:hypothetical protein
VPLQFPWVNLNYPYGPLDFTPAVSISGHSGAVGQCVLDRYGSLGIVRHHNHHVHAEIASFGCDRADAVPWEVSVAHLDLMQTSWDTTDGQADNIENAGNCSETVEAAARLGLRPNTG